MASFLQKIWARSGAAKTLLTRFYSKAKVCSDGSEGLASSKKGLALGVYECDGSYVLTQAAQKYNDKSKGRILELLCGESNGLPPGTAKMFTNLCPDFAAVALCGLGRSEPGYNYCEALDETRENVRLAAGAGVRELRKMGCGQILVEDFSHAEEAAEGAVIAGWGFQEFKQEHDREVTPLVDVFESQDSEGWCRGVVKGECQNWARYLSDMPSNRMTPTDFAQSALECLCEHGIRVEARDREWILQNKMQVFLAVAKGSCEPPIFLEAMYTGAPQGPRYLMCGQGTTFDSGGLCLKRGDGMAEGRAEMAGAAVTVATLRGLAALKVPVNVSAVIPLCENMISGQCLKAGDVLRALNGTTIQVEDTANEGRLILSDALVYGQAVYKPKFIMDVSTLTRGIQRATGGGCFGCWTNSSEYWDVMKNAGAISGDRPWRFPLWKCYQRTLKKQSSTDLNNKGKGVGEACLGAAFLSNFICGSWMHLDVTGVGRLTTTKDISYLSTGRMSGRPTRTCIQFFEELSKCPQEPSEKPC